MRNFILSILVLFPLCLFGQQTEGTVLYQEVMQLNIELPPEYQQYASQIPKERKSNMDLFFNSEASLYKESTVVVEAEENPFEGRGPRRGGRFGGSGETYLDLATQERLVSREMMGQYFLIVEEEEEPKLEWKIAMEQKEIAGYNCMKATAMNPDTTEVIAWFAPEIPVSSGPQGYGGLPGLILDLKIDHPERPMQVSAQEVNLDQLEKGAIVKPSKGKEYTRTEFRAMMDEKRKEMRAMYGGGKGGPGGRGGGGPIIIRQ